MFPRFVVGLAKATHIIPLFRASLRQIACCGPLAATAFAQYNSYRFDHWTTDNGLPQNTVTSVVQTRDGYLWLTTFDGLARFDGVRFAVFDKGNTKGINTNRFTSLYETGDGTLLIGTEDGGLIAYRNGTFTTYTTADGLPSNEVFRVTPDFNGEPVIHTSKGPGYLRDGKIVLAPLQYQSREVKLYLAPSGAQVTVDASGVKRVKDGRVTHYSFTPITKIFFDGVWIYEDGQENLWIADSAKTYLLRDGQITIFTELKSLQPSRHDPDGGVWFGLPIGVKFEGDYLVRYKDGRFMRFTETDGILLSLIYSIITDREGSIWLATSRRLYRARKRLMTAHLTESCLASHEVYPLLQSREGDVWVGSTLGLNRVRLRKGMFEAFPTIQPGVIVQALREDAMGRLWIGAVGRLWRYKNGKIRELLRDLTPCDVKTDREGYYWVATERGVFKFDDDKLVAQYTTKDGLPSDDVKIIHPDRHGALWFGTYGGLSQFKDGKFTNYTAAEGLTGNRVRTIYEDAEGTLWVGTYDDGLSRFRDGRFFNHRIEQGLFNNGVFQILEDRHGYFWIGFNKGIYRVSRRELDDLAEGRISRVGSVAFGKQDGMINTECNGGRQPAGFTAQDGRFWFPTMGGAVVIDPEAAKLNPQPPPVMIEAVTLERRQAIAAGAEHSLALKNTGEAVVWGANFYGQLYIPEAAKSGVTAIAAGKYHSLALKPPNTTPVAVSKNVTISAGADCTATVTADQVNNGSYDPDNDPITLSLDSTGPFGLGAHTVTLTVADSNGASDSATATVTVTNTDPSLGNYPNSTVTVGGSATVTPASPPSDTNPISSVTVMAPGFTGGISVNATTGAVSITNAGPVGGFLVTVKASDVCGAQTMKTFTLNVTANTCGITVNPATLPQPYIAVPYARILSASPAGNYTFSVSAGQLPPGLQLTTALGVTSIAGLPTTPGTYNFTIKAKRNNSTCEATRSYTLTIPATVVPLLECVQRNQNGSWTARFGYDNSTGAAVTIPVGNNNYFTPGNRNRGQTTVFQPGRVANAFSVTFNANGKNLGVWFLRGPDGVLRPVNALTTSIGCP